jgi:DNA-binding XRE family transcriptional regulator
VADQRYYISEGVVTLRRTIMLMMEFGTRLDACSEVGPLLRDLRRRIDPTVPTLGEFERLNTRRGKAVSQEELAEAVGVSRGWYAMLERGEPIQPSIVMLSRLARALNATRDERVSLFELAIPELQGLL